MPPRASVVIPSHGTDRVPLVQRAVQAVADGLDEAEALVVTDAPGAVEEALADVEGAIEADVVAFEGGVSAARNRGLEAAEGEVVALLDDDMVPAGSWAGTVDTLADEGERIVTGPVRPALDGEPVAFPHLWVVGCRQVAGADETETLYGGNLVLAGEARDLRFDERLGPKPDGWMFFEDTDFCHRALGEGVPVRTDPDLVVHHELDPEDVRFRALARRAFDLGVSARMYQRFAAREGRSSPSSRYVDFLRALVVGDDSFDYLDVDALGPRGHVENAALAGLRALGYLRGIVASYPDELAEPEPREEPVP